MFSCCLGRGSTSETPHAHGSKRLEVDARKVNDSLYELWKPSGTPKMELLFFHGLQLGDLSDAHLRTWESEDGSSLWPQKWLVEEFPMARILCVSYNGRVRKSSGSSFDMHVIVENLISDFMQGKMAQTPNCPVVLIGHCFGGLVIEKLCLEANKLKQVGLESQRPQIGTYLDNVKGVFFYGVPHHGTPGLSNATKLLKSPLLSYFETLGKDASRFGFEFNQLRRVYAAWQIWGLGENLPGDRGIFDGIVAAPEATARSGDNFNLLPVDYMSICRPQDKDDKRFYFLTELLHIITTNSEVELPVHETHGLPRYPIDMERRALEVRDELIGGTTLGLFGTGGIGKTTLAMQTFNTISKDFEYTCFVDNVKSIPLQGLEDWLLNHFHQRGKRLNGTSTSWFHLKDKKTLIVVGDIDSVDRLKVLPDLKHFGTGSFVIMTSRVKEDFKHGALSENMHIAWKNLVSRSLVKEISKKYSVRHPYVYNQYKEIWVHEQLRDLAKKIANGIMESGSDETTNSIVDRLNDNKLNPRTKCLSLLYSKGFRKNRTTLQLDSLATLESLKHMDVLGVSSEGCGKGLTRKISVIKLEGEQGYQLSKFKFNLINMENLTVLELSHFQIQKEFPDALGNLTNLQILCLSNLEGLDYLPESFGSLHRLRKLELNRFSLMILPKSFGNLVALEYHLARHKIFAVTGIFRECVLPCEIVNR